MNELCMHMAAGQGGRGHPLTGAASTRGSCRFSAIFGAFQQLPVVPGMASDTQRGEHSFCSVGQEGLPDLSV